MSRLSSRLLLACSLVAALAATAGARPSSSPSMFAQPPPADATSPDAAAPSEAPPPPGRGFRALQADRDEVRTKLIANRAANLARFRAYIREGVFPSNIYTAGALNVWRDHQGRFCAAATIIRASGSRALADQVAEDDNFIRLADVTSGPLMDWILTSGLTQAEVALIQEPFRPVIDRPAFDAGTIVAISPAKRAAEDRRLARLYRQIEATLVKHQRQSLEAAVDELMMRPSLAWRLVHPA